MNSSTTLSKLLVTDENPGQVPNAEIQPAKKPRPSFYSRLFSRSRPLAADDMLMDGSFIPSRWVDPPVPVPTFVSDEDERIVTEYDGDDIEDFEADPDDQD